MALEGPRGHEDIDSPSRQLEAGRSTALQVVELDWSRMPSAQGKAWRQCSLTYSQRHQRRGQMPVRLHAGCREQSAACSGLSPARG